MGRLTKLAISLIAAAFLFAGCGGYTHFPKDVVYYSNSEAIHIDMPKVDYYTWQDVMNLKFFMKAKGLTELHIHMLNPGGYVLPMIEVINQLELMKKDGIKVVTHGHGIIGSAAIPIFLQGDQRIMYKSAQVFLHNSTHDQNRQYMNEDTWKANMEWKDRYILIVAQKTKLTKQQVIEYTSGNPRYDLVWFNEQECLKLGFATELR